MVMQVIALPRLTGPENHRVDDPNVNHVLTFKMEHSGEADHTGKELYAVPISNI